MERHAAVPEMRTVVSEAQRVALVLAMARHGGNVTQASTALGTSRRTLREHLRAQRLYPWDRVAADGGLEDDGEHLEREHDDSGDDDPT